MFPRPYQANINPRNSLNRYSMPVTRSRNGLYEINLDQTNTARFLFGDDEPNALPRGNTPDDHFPTLVRREDQMVSESSFCALNFPVFRASPRSVTCKLQAVIRAPGWHALTELHLPAGVTSPSPHITLELALCDSTEVHLCYKYLVCLLTLLHISLTILLRILASIPDCSP
jgi:hypothetical protein